MPRGKARKISADMVIDSDSDDSIQVVDNHASGIKDSELPVVPEHELSNDNLPASVSIDTRQDAPDQRASGVKRKISALVPSKQTPAERKHLFQLTFEFTALTVITEDNSEHPKVTYHLKIASASELKKQPSKRTNVARILKVAQSLKFPKFQNSITDIVAHVLGLSTLVSTYEDFQVLFTIARKVSDPTPLLSDEDYEIMIDNIRKAKDPAVSLFICALKVCYQVTSYTCMSKWTLTSRWSRI
jgi:hypothetical protein